MNQLHQLLAVIDDLKKKSNAIQSETTKTFSSKQEHFDGLTKIYSAYDESSNDNIPAEIKNVVTTVSDKINYTSKPFIQALDAELSLDETNSSGNAKAELICNNISFGFLSASSLLDLEKNLLKIREIYKNIPTLDLTKQWADDSNTGKNIYTTTEEIKYRTNKVYQPFVKYEATKDHPAQVDVLQKDIQVGEYKTVYKSGKISSANKSELLSRIDSLIISVKKARSIANQCEVTNVKIGNKLFDFINKDIL